MLFDELDTSLHPTLTARLVRLFQGRSSNPAGAQLVFTTHDVSLLNQLNRDEVGLTQKESDGATRFAALSDSAGERVRRSRNIETGYLSGRFGARDNDVSLVARSASGSASLSSWYVELVSRFRGDRSVGVGVTRC